MAGSYPEQVPTSALGVSLAAGVAASGKVGSPHVTVLLHRDHPEVLHR